MTHNNRYYRARIQTIVEHTPHYQGQEKKWLQNGFIPETEREDFEMWIKARMHDKSDEPLTFVELATYSTWFAMHPEKVAGEMVGGSSLFFPVVVKGTRQDVERLHKSAMSADNSPLAVSPLLEMLVEILKIRKL